MIKINNRDTSTITPGRGQKLDPYLAGLKPGMKISVKQIDTGHIEILEVKGMSEYQLYIKFEDYKAQSQWIKGQIEVDIL